MEIVFILALLNNIISTIYSYKSEKNNTKWLDAAKNAYQENLNTLFYPKSEVALKKKYVSFASIELRTIISAWIITFTIPFFFDLKIFVIIYLLNFMYGKILYILSILDTKINVINEHIFNEDEDL